MGFGGKQAAYFRKKIGKKELSAAKVVTRKVNVAVAKNSITETGYDNPKCYAYGLHSCSKQMSREHYISKSILKKFGKIETSGIPWVKNASELPAENLFITNKLCENHNKHLSEIDKKFSQFFDHAEILHKVPNISFSIDGQILERWLLKLILGLESTGNLRSLEISSSERMHFLRCLFGFEELDGERGLYVHYRVSDKIKIERDITFQILENNTKIAGIYISICGLRFYLTLHSMDVSFFKHASENLIYRISKIDLSHLKSELLFRW